MWALGQYCMLQVMEVACQTEGMEEAKPVDTAGAQVNPADKAGTQAKPADTAGRLQWIPKAHSGTTTQPADTAGRQRWIPKSTPTSRGEYDHKRQVESPTWVDEAGELVDEFVREMGQALEAQEPTIKRICSDLTDFIRDGGLKQFELRIFGSRCHMACVPDSDLDLCCVVVGISCESWLTQTITQLSTWSSQADIQQLPANERAIVDLQDHLGQQHAN